MAILSQSELYQYAPGVQIGGPYIDALIARTQAYAEGPLGANRKLETTTYREIIEIPDSPWQFYLPYFPVSNSAVIQTRSGGLGGWQDLSATAYHIYEDGQVEIDLVSHGVFTIHLYSQPVIQIRAVYESGFDFTDSSNSDVILIKSIVGQLLTELWKTQGGADQTSANSEVNSGRVVQEIDYEDDVKVKYSTAGSVGSTAIASQGDLNKLVTSILYPLKKYGPRGLPNAS